MPGGPRSHLGRADDADAKHLENWKSLELSEELGYPTAGFTGFTPQVLTGSSSAERSGVEGGK